VERENAFFKSSPVAEYHLPQMNSEKVFFGCSDAGVTFESYEKVRKLQLTREKIQINFTHGETFCHIVRISEEALKKPCRGFYVSRNILPTSFVIDQIQNIIDIGN
jgi:hypothetical protein